MIGGGSGNKTTEPWGVIGGGYQHLNAGANATVSGGFADSAFSNFSSISGGLYNVTKGSRDAIGGGEGNRTEGFCAMVPGGKANIAAGDFSLAGGRRARAQEGSLVWADAQDVDFPAPGDPQFMPPLLSNQLLVRATGGALIASAVDGSGFVTSGVSLAAGSGSWSSLSDRTLKTDVEPIDASAILTKVASLPLNSWRYQAQHNGTRHIGPMAQDFYAAFGVGDDSRHITTIDADGVALAAIQALLARVHELEERLAELEQARKAEK